MPRRGPKSENDFQQAKQAFEDYIRQNGLRSTPEREEIIRAVFQLKAHFSVAQVAEVVRRGGGKTSLTTIYRNMGHLLRAGLVNEVGCGACGDGQVYEHVFRDRHHDHLRCVHCGRVVEFEEEAIEVLQKHVAEKYGFRLVRHYLDLQGVCPECDKKTE